MISARDPHYWEKQTSRNLGLDQKVNEKAAVLSFDPCSQ